ncbi:MAG TPA: PCYCGC motif-containing (lipo)protein [Candidatus Limnocylindria bacterium]
MRRRELLLAAAASALAACAAPVVTKASAQPASSLLAMPLHDMWPMRYQQAPQAVREAYAFAVDHRAELRYIPCFCGCGTSAGHRDNFDCFVKDQTAPGTFMLDPHGFACGTCVGVALDTKALLASGLSLKAIRAAIDAKWSEVGPATPTPYPDE